MSQQDFVSDEWTFVCGQCERCGGLDFLSLMVHDNGELICSNCVMKTAYPTPNASRDANDDRAQRYDALVTRPTDDERSAFASMAGALNAARGTEGRV